MNPYRSAPPNPPTDEKPYDYASLANRPIAASSYLRGAWFIGWLLANGIALVSGLSQDVAFLLALGTGLACVVPFWVRERSSLNTERYEQELEEKIARQEQRQKRRRRGELRKA